MLKNRVKEMIEELFAENPTVKGVRVTALADLFTKKLDEPVSVKFISGLAREAGYEVERQSDGFMVMRKDDPKINNDLAIKRLLEQGRKVIEKQQAQKAEMELAWAEEAIEYDAIVSRLILAEIPEALHEHTKIEAIGKQKRKVSIHLPGIAAIAKQLRIIEDKGTESNIGTIYRPIGITKSDWYIEQWQFNPDYESDDQALYLGRESFYCDEYEDLSLALANAERLGDNRKWAEDRLLQSKQLTKQVEQNRKPICPLMSIMGSEWQECQGDKCAWFISNVTITDSCAVKIMAHAEMAKVVKEEGLQECPACSGFGHYLVGNFDETCSECDGHGKV